MNLLQTFGNNYHTNGRIHTHTHKIRARKKFWPYTFPYVWSTKLCCAESYASQLFTIYLQCTRGVSPETEKAFHVSIRI